MSKTAAAYYYCPHCGQKNMITVWTSLNGLLNPEAKQKLLDGTLFFQTCKTCGKVELVNYTMLYHDMQHNAMIYYMHDRINEDALRMFIEAKSKMDEQFPGYQIKMRIVTDQNVLREKAIIFNQGQDDRVVELMKLIYLFDMGILSPDDIHHKNYGRILVFVRNGHYIAEYSKDGKTSHVEFSNEFYDMVQEDYKEELEDFGDDYMEVDLTWAHMLITDEKLQG